MELTLPVILYLVLATAGILVICWLYFPRGPTMEQIVAQRGPLHVFPELRLPRWLREKPETPSVRDEALCRSAVLFMLLWMMSGSHHHDGRDDDY